MSNRQTDPREMPALLVTAFRQFARLVQDEVALAKAELHRNVSYAGAGLAMLAVAALFALTAMDVLAHAAIAALAANDMSPGLAALLVGGGLALLALVLVLAGRARLRAVALRPDRAERNLRDDMATLQGARDD